MTEQGGSAGGSAPTERPGGEPSTERVVIRDRRKIDREAVSSDSAAGEPVIQPEPSQPEAAQPEQVGEAAGAAAHAGDDLEQARPTDETRQPEEPAQPEAAGKAAAVDPDTAEAPEPAACQGAELDEDAAVSTAAAVAESTAADTAAPTPEDVLAEAPAKGLDAELEALRAELEERVKDLQRVTAEYANYRKRVDRDRGRVAEQATGNVLTALLPVLDDLDRAREHGDLVGPFGSVAEQFTGALSKFGLTAFGEKGDPFDPTRHEAVAHLTSAEVSEPTCVEVMRRGYLLGDRLLRAALVAVADPES